MHLVRAVELPALAEFCQSYGVETLGCVHFFTNGGPAVGDYYRVRICVTDDSADVIRDTIQTHQEEGLTIVIQLRTIPRDERIEAALQTVRTLGAEHEALLAEHQRLREAMAAHQEARR